MFRVLMTRQQSVVFAFDIHEVHHARFDRSEAQVCFRKGDRYDGSRDRYRAHTIRDQASERFFEFLERSQLGVAHITEIAPLLLGEQITISNDRECYTEHSDAV